MQAANTADTTKTKQIKAFYLLQEFPPRHNKSQTNKSFVSVVAYFVFCNTQQSNDDSDSGEVDEDLEEARMGGRQTWPEVDIGEQCIQTNKSFLSVAKVPFKTQQIRRKLYLLLSMASPVFGK
jgi:hypothetical protein